MPLELTVVDFLVLSILVLWVGDLLTKRVRFLDANNIPIAVTGGLLFSIGAAVYSHVSRRPIAFDMRMRDLLLLIFFSTIGLGAKLKTLGAGGKSLGILVVVSAVFLVLQNLIGVGLATAMGAHPGYGLLGGSISFAGGHGTAIAWGSEAERAGLVNGSAIGIAFATFGLIVGGLVGGPIAGWLVRRNDLQPSEEPSGVTTSAPDTVTHAGKITTRELLGTILSLALCVGIGDSVNRWLFETGVLLPGFLTSMLVGIVITNSRDLRGAPLREETVSTTGDIALQLFLAMSLMSMDLSSLGAAASPVLIVLACQALLITVFTVFVVFRVLGRDYDAAVIAGGFAGLGLGATPVAIANMHAVTAKFGPSPKAFLVIPLVGAFFIDILNALIIKLFIALPMMAPPG